MLKLYDKTQIQDNTKVYLMSFSLNQTEITNLLHHRPPYLMVDFVEEMNPTYLRALKTPKLSDFYIQGHFPGAHVVPGAKLQEMSTQSAGVLVTKYFSPVENYNSNETKGYALGVLSKVNYAKYKSFAKPDIPITIVVNLTQHLEDLFKFKAELFQSNELIMKNSFNLVNIEDFKLTGD